MELTLQDTHLKNTITGKETKMESVENDFKAMCKEIADHYGYPSQSSQLMEECAELIQAVNKYKRAKTSDAQYIAFRNYVEEIADVEIMLEQIKYLIGVKDADLEETKKFKLHRTLDKFKES